MYIKNAEKFLIKLGFIKNNDCEFYKKIDEKNQLFAVSTDENDIMFISEHKILRPIGNQLFEEDDLNYEILSEFVTIRDLSYILYKNDLISKLYYDLLNTIQNLKIGFNKLNDISIKEEIEQLIDWADLSIYYMNEEIDGTIWASENDIQDFIEVSKPYYK